MWFFIEPIIFPLVVIHALSMIHLEFFFPVHSLDWIFYFCASKKMYLTKIDCADPLVMKCHVRWSMAENEQNKKTKINFSYFKLLEHHSCYSLVPTPTSISVYVNIMQCTLFWSTILGWQMFALLLSLVGLCTCAVDITNNAHVCVQTRTISFLLQLKTCGFHYEVIQDKNLGTKEKDNSV